LVINSFDCLDGKYADILYTYNSVVVMSCAGLTNQDSLEKLYNVDFNYLINTTLDLKNIVSGPRHPIVTLRCSWFNYKNYHV